MILWIIPFLCHNRIFKSEHNHTSINEPVDENLISPINSLFNNRTHSPGTRVYERVSNWVSDHLPSPGTTIAEDFARFVSIYITITFTFQHLTRWSCYRVKLEQRENCQEFQLSGVLEFRTGVLELDRTLERGGGTLDIGTGRWDIDLNLIYMSVSW